VVKINKGFQKHIKQCYDSLHIENEDEKCFLSRKKKVYSTQRINILFKEIKQHYNLKIDHFSTHTMRKTFGRKVFESAGTDAPLALMRLQTLFNHASPTITKRYLGITDSELESSYDLLDF
jgi:site-specific recombinase XerD